MADSNAFQFVCDALEQQTDLARLEARGTIRLTLKEAGLEAGTVTAQQLAVAVDRLLAPQLEARGVEDPGAVCGALASSLIGFTDDSAAETPDHVFARLGGDA